MNECGDIYIGTGYSSVFSCVRDLGHDGPHRSFGGSEWTLHPGEASKGSET